MAANSISDASKQSTAYQVAQWMRHWEHDLVTDGNCGCIQRRHFCEMLQRKYMSRMPDGTPHYNLYPCQTCKHKLTDKDETPAPATSARRLKALTDEGYKMVRQGLTRYLKNTGRIS